MKLLILTLTFLAVGQFSFAMGTQDRVSYIITLDKSMNSEALDTCVENICKLSGTRTHFECEIVSERFKIAAATLSNSALNKVKAMKCVKSARAERYNYTPRPRSGTSN